MGSKEPDYNADNPIVRDSQPVNETANLTDAFTREACDFIRRHQTQPFFLYLAYNAVHSPLQGADAYMEKFRHIPDIHRRIFAAMLANLDDGIGTVLATLRETGIERDTLVVFLSDNGGATRELTSSNAPLRGEKGQIYEGGIRVPFILRWPAQLPAGRVVETPVISMDVTATALAAAGATVEGAGQDGINLIPLLTTDKAPDKPRTFYWRAGTRAAMRQGDWKIVRDGARGRLRQWQLFNLAADVAEGTDLAVQEPERLKTLVALWEKWSATQVEPAW
jgi:arylsulfatase B